MKAKTKKILTGIIALTLTAAVSAGGTFAFLTRLTEKRANNFTFATSRLNATLTEPEWDGVTGYVYDKDGVHPLYEDSTPDDPVYGYYIDEDGEQHKLKYPPDKLNDFIKDGSYPDDIDDAVKNWLDQKTDKVTWDDYEQPDKVNGKTPGYLDAQNMVPAQEAAKNPFITNTGDLEEWVAAKVSFVYASEEKAGQVLSSDDFAKVLNVIQIDWPTANVSTGFGETGAWHYANAAATLTSYGNDYTSQMIFYYDAPLDTAGDGSKTAPIFTTVRVNKEATRDDIKMLEAMGGFTIYIEGYAVQKDAFETGSEWVKVSVADDAKWKATFVSDGKAADAVIAYIGGNGITGADDALEAATEAAEQIAEETEEIPEETPEAPTEDET